MIVQRPVWREVFLWTAEQLTLLLLLLLPRSVLVRTLQSLVARRVFACGDDSVTLYKSGRAALHGALETLRLCDPKRSEVWIPDYTCNVVASACRAAGYSVRTYATTESCMPVWAELEESVRTAEVPVVLLCSLFGVVPVTDDGLSGVLAANGRTVVIADECQNVVPGSGVGQTPAHVIIFSFNDKTCPGVMGGGTVWNRGAFGTPFVEKAPWRRRWHCRAGLLGLYVSRTASDALHMLRLCASGCARYAKPAGYEYSRCQSAHYDVRAEAIYKLSAARAIISVRALARYRCGRAASVQEIRKCAGDRALVDARAAALCAPPFVPVREVLLDANPDPLGFPLKAPYAPQDDPHACLRPFYAIKLTTPFVRLIGKV